jgi:hypothetical protein
VIGALVQVFRVLPRSTSSRAGGGGAVEELEAALLAKYLTTGTTRRLYKQSNVRGLGVPRCSLVVVVEFQRRRPCNGVLCTESQVLCCSASYYMA